MSAATKIHSIYKAGVAAAPPNENVGAALLVGAPKAGVGAGAAPNAGAAGVAAAPKLKPPAGFCAVAAPNEKAITSPASICASETPSLRAAAHNRDKKLASVSLR